MPQSFFYLWTRKEFADHCADENAVLWSASGNQFRKRGLELGDRVYVVSCFEQKLFLLGRIDVSEILNPAEAREHTGDDDSPWNWASDHIFCNKANVRQTLFDTVVPDDVIRSMKFEHGRSPVWWEANGRLIPNPQSFRGFRRMSLESACDLDRLLEIGLAREADLSARRRPAIGEPKPSKVKNAYWLVAERKIGDYPCCTERSGKWLIFVAAPHVDEVWAKVKEATEKGLLGHAAKVSTTKPNSNAKNRDRRVICIYTYDWADEADVKRIRSELRDLGIVAKIPYKTDKVTSEGVYANHGGKRIAKYFE